MRVALEQRASETCSESLTCKLAAGSYCHGVASLLAAQVIRLTKLRMLPASIQL